MRAGAELQSTVTTALTSAFPSAVSLKGDAHLLRFFSYKAKFGSSWAILSLDFLAAGPAGSLANTTNRKVNFGQLTNFI